METDYSCLKLSGEQEESLKVKREIPTKRQISAQLKPLRGSLTVNELVLNIPHLHLFLILESYKLKKSSQRLKYRKGGLLGYLTEVEGLLPLTDLKQKYDDKYVENPLFKTLFDLLDFDAIYSYFHASPGSNFVSYLTEYHVDWMVYYNQSREFFEHPEVISVIFK